MHAASAMAVLRCQDDGQGDGGLAKCEGDGASCGKADEWARYLERKERRKNKAGRWLLKSSSSSEVSSLSSTLSSTGGRVAPPTSTTIRNWAPALNYGEFPPSHDYSHCTSGDAWTDPEMERRLFHTWH
mmetsp:Transcript_12649/g.35825  ORF Transcript_12649/g.35825 Transcript_12649/m.35825 type:complete len:129 (-) Transcript_12649:171-557(-)